MRRWFKRIGLSLVRARSSCACRAAASRRHPADHRAQGHVRLLIARSNPRRAPRTRPLSGDIGQRLCFRAIPRWTGPAVSSSKPGTEGSGRSWADEGLPFLTAPNITPDRETGAGTWTDDMLARAIREGIGHDGRTLFPLMPYPQYKYMADEDLASIVVYLRSLPPVRKQLPPSAIPFPVEPVHQRRARTGHRACAAAEQERSGRVRRLPGAHRRLPRLPHAGRRSGRRRFPAWSSAAASRSRAPHSGPIASANITSDPSGIPYYTEDLFLEVMRTGMVRSRKLHNYMPWRMYGKQTDEDLEGDIRLRQDAAAGAAPGGQQPSAHRLSTLWPAPRGGNQNKPAADNSQDRAQPRPRRLRSQAESRDS